MATLTVRDIHYAYPGANEQVVEGWSDIFEAGCVTALTGESGCGKSTRLFLAALMMTPSDGEILFNGQRVDNLSDAQRAAIRAHHFGFVFQDAALDQTRTVIDNVLETCLYRGQRHADFVDEAVELLDRMKVSVPLDRRPGQISGGQAQRISLCRALLGRPSVIFADEPTGNLDEESSRAVMEMLCNSAAQGATVIVVTHDPDVVSMADRQVTISIPQGGFPSLQGKEQKMSILTEKREHFS